MWFLNYENFCGSFENQTILDDVISGRKWWWIKKSFGGIKDLGLKNHMQQSDLHYLFSVDLRNYLTEAMFSIFKWEKIDQNELWLGIQKLFHTKSSTLNPMSWSVFSNREVGRSSKLKLRATNAVLWGYFIGG